MAQVGRPPSAKTLVDRQLGRDRIPMMPTSVPAGESFRIPNYSGDHSAGKVLKTPTDSHDIVNKSYADSIPASTGTIRTFNINRGALLASNYMQSNSLVHSSTTGIAMNRAGSIVGLSLTFLCSAFTSGARVFAYVRINDVDQFYGEVNVTGTGSYQILSTQNYGTYNVAAGDYVQVYILYELGLSCTFSNISGNVEVACPSFSV